MDFTYDAILARLKAGLKNADTKIEGSFTMDNIQAVAQELARLAEMELKVLWKTIEEKIDENITSGNPAHFEYWAMQAADSDGNKLLGNARSYEPRDGSTRVYIACITPSATAPDAGTLAQVADYIESQRPVGSNPIVEAGVLVDVTVEASVLLRSGASAAEVRAEAVEKLSAYFTEVAFSRDESRISLNYYAMTAVLLEVAGIQQIVDLTVNGGDETVIASYNEFFTLREMILNAVN